jgi:hypothetical protein
MKSSTSHYPFNGFWEEKNTMVPPVGQDGQPPEYLFHLERDHSVQSCLNCSGVMSVAGPSDIDLQTPLRWRFRVILGTPDLEPESWCTMPPPRTASMTAWIWSSPQGPIGIAFAIGLSNRKTNILVDQQMVGQTVSRDAIFVFPNRFTSDVGT